MLKQSVLPYNAVYLPKTSPIGWSEKREMRARKKNTLAHRQMTDAFFLSKVCSF
jgi:hypothetical protein